MSLLSEIREDVRLARLNNPGYSALFRLMDVAIGLFKLLVLAVVGLGLWHLIYDISVADSKKNLRQLADALKTPADAIVEPTPDYPELTPERIEMLRQFAKNNRNSDADTSEGSLTAATSIDAASSDSAIVNLVPRPDAIVDQGNDVAEQTASIQGKPTLEIKSDGLFEALEKKLLPAVSLGDGATTSAAQELGGDVEPLTTDRIEGAPLANAKSPESEAPVVEAPAATLDSAGEAAAPAGELNGEKWLLAQNPDYYVIQIGSTTNRPFLVRFAGLLPEDQPKAVYQYIFRKSPEYGLSFGLYETKAQANAALEQLSQKARRYGAFSRKISILHKQIAELVDKVAFVQ